MFWGGWRGSPKVGFPTHIKKTRWLTIQGMVRVVSFFFFVLEMLPEDTSRYLAHKNTNTVKIITDAVHLTITSYGLDYLLVAPAVPAASPSSATSFAYSASACT